MKKILLLTLLLSEMVLAQMPNISKVWLNDLKPYQGFITKEKVPISVVFSISEQDKANDQEYFISGKSEVEGQVSPVEGKIKIKKYKDTKKGGKVYGTYELAEEPGGEHTGIFTGKYVFKFRWNKESEAIENQEITFEGDWKNYQGNLDFPTVWSNQPEHDP